MRNSREDVTGGGVGAGTTVRAPAQTGTSAAGNRTILLAEGSSSYADTYTRSMRAAGLQVTAVSGGHAALKALTQLQPRLVVLDLGLPEISGLQLLANIRELRNPPTVIVTTSDGSLSSAIKAVRCGAYDYLVKPFSNHRLITAVEDALNNARPAEVGDLAGPSAAQQSIIGSSRAMQAVHRLVDTAAASKATVFITGESGTGKEMIAEMIHQGSGRGAKPFVALNCSAIPKDLAESEIFGHIKGSFTGAVGDHRGAALQADGGTLFLDEICEMNIDLQAKLLRFLQAGVVRRVGAANTEKVDVRIICATNRDPAREVKAGRFREDLYYRLHVIPVRLPPLRERANDAVEIARALLALYSQEEGKRFQRLSACAEAAIARYSWPGNVRQLQNVMRNAVVLNDGEELTAADIPELVGFCSRPELDPGDPAGEDMAIADEGDGRLITAEFKPEITPLAQLEQEAIERAIAMSGNNIARAAAALGVSPSTIYRKRQSWGCDGAL